MSQSKKIVVVDDDADIVDLLTFILTKEGYEVKSAANGKEAIQVVQEYKPELLILDVMMPEMDGIETCRHLRKTYSNQVLSVLFLTARSEEYTEVAAFDAGANDFISKPIKPRALISRVNAYFRNDILDSKDKEILEIADLIIDKKSYTITYQGNKMILPKKEFELLFFLASHPDVVYSREDLLLNIWGSDVYVTARTVDVHIRKIREKINEEYIATVKGIGYKFALV